MHKVFFYVLFFIGLGLFVIQKSTERIQNRAALQNIKVTLIVENQVFDTEMEPFSTLGEVIQKLDIKIPFDESKINRNRIVSNRDVITLPLLTQDKEKSISINTGTVSELESLPGIGPKMAERIISYRNEKGLFKTIEDLRKVKGMGESKFAKIVNHISL